MIWFVLWITLTFPPIHSKNNVFSSVSYEYSDYDDDGTDYIYSSLWMENEEY